MSGKINAGYVALELLERNGDETETLCLKPTLAAIKAISTHFGSIQDAMQRVAARNFQAVEYIVQQGLALDKKAARGLDERIYRTGVNDVAGPCIEYLGVLQRGGRPLTDEPESDEGDEGNG